MRDLFNNEGVVPNPPGFYLGGKRFYLISFLKDDSVAYFKNEEGGACVCKT